MGIKIAIIFTLILLSLPIFSWAGDYQYAKNNEVRIAYRVFGKGLPLVVLNGGPGRSSDTFIELAEKLSSFGFQVILFDQRGTGKSNLPSVDESTVTLDLMVSDLEALRKELRFTKLALLGHSFGGMYAMAYASKYPEHIESIILSASGGMNTNDMIPVEDNIKSKLSESDLKKYKFWMAPEQRKKDSVQAKLEILKITAPIYVYKKEHVKKITENLTNLNFYNPQINQLVWKSMENNKYNVTNSFKNFKSKTLIIDGDKDFLGKEIPEKIHKNIPNSQLKILKNCSHYPWLDTPNEYYSLIKNFLNRN